jgi:hypothetical protein
MSMKMQTSSRFVSRSRAGREDGMALITVILVTMLCAALMVGFVSAIVTDQRSSGLDRDQTQAYAAAHAGLEKLTSDLSALFRSDFSPAAAQLNTVAGASNRPVIQGFTYTAPEGGSGYTITWPFSDANGNPAPESMTGSAISAGPYQGFMGLITPYTLTVTARSTAGAEVRLRRTLQTVAIPVFQFGMFSETDLAFHAGADGFSFGGRVHTNGNLFLAAADSSDLVLSDRITAVKEIIRTHLPNDLPVTDGYQGTVIVPTVIKTPTNTTRALARTEGSLKGTSGKPSDPLNSTFWTATNSSWDSLSTGTYKSNIRNGKTGARRLDLPLVADVDGNGAPDAEPIELIRRPRVNDPAHILQQRYFSLASIRILLSDDPADIQNLPTVTQGTQPVLLNPGVNYTNGAVVANPNMIPPLAASAGPNASGTIPADVYQSNAGEPLLGGYIKIEMQLQNNTWMDVTADVLALGIAGRNLADYTPTTLSSRLNDPGPNTGAGACPEPNPNAVIRLQRVRDVPIAAQTSTSTAARIGFSCGYTVDASNNLNGVSQNSTDYWPNTIYDSREARTRDGITSTDLTLGGIMHYIELDMNNLRRYILGQIGTLGNQARNDNGFVVYFSDRRNNNTAAGAETAEFGYEDTVNPATTAGTPNNTLDAGEDLNGNGTLEDYGERVYTQNLPAGNSLRCPLTPLLGIRPLDCLATVNTVLQNGTGADQVSNKALAARANKALFFRRALKVVNGGIVGGVNPIVEPGLTIASENPVYIQGNFNATSTSANVEPNRATAIIADAVTILSNAWNDIRSFTSPVDASGRPASTTAYRVAIVTGKTRPFPKPSFASSSFGSDGGAHNFVRALENWNNGSVTRYRGSFVSFFYSRQATGSFKCCQNDVYTRGDRDWTFDTDFLVPSLLPPATPMFRDVNTLTFRQLLRPNQ